jgi:hypothetical protein
LTGNAATNARAQGGDHGDPEGRIDQPGVHGARDQRHDQVVRDLHDGDRECVGRKHHAQRGEEAKAGLDEGQGGQGVAEQEREPNGEADGDGGAESHRRSDHQAGDLADGAAGEAVQRGARRHAVASVHPRSSP